MIVQEYQPRWAAEFAALGDVLVNHLGTLALSIDHVGSTSVPGMLAKPILDVDIEIPADATIDQLSAKLAELGYRYEGEKGIPDRHAYRKMRDDVPFTEPRRAWMNQHIYVCRTGTVEHRRHLHFRDALVASPELREEYRAIKQRCATSADGDTMKYQAAKDAHCEFFNRVLAMEPIAQRVNRAHDLLDANRQAYERGEIDEATWYRNVAAVITPAYLRGRDPKEQSGFSGDDARWERARGVIAEAIDRDGTFLDVGCASGYLMETMQRWCSRKGVKIEPYGLDIAPELAELAQSRRPQWSDRVFVGNAIEWRHPGGVKFDFVRTGLEYVPPPRQQDLVRHLLAHVVDPGGRLIVGTYNEARASLVEPLLEHRVAEMGFRIAGRIERPHSDCRIVYRVFWIDNDGSVASA
jgi:GrpB-like predicted nucleotidyltransferase (UPF0157 family)/2-polyprenyl-3-methyl-5-hydroxy-6-metoxy-1,4-benzoquinol methylase